MPARIYDNATVETYDGDHNGVSVEVVEGGHLVHLYHPAAVVSHPYTTLPRRSVTSIEIVCDDEDLPDGADGWTGAEVAWSSRAPWRIHRERTVEDLDTVTVFHDGWLRAVRPADGMADWTLTDYPPHAYKAVRWRTTDATQTP